MSNKKSNLTMLFIVCLALFFGSVFCFALLPSPKHYAPLLPSKSENEKFLDLQQRYAHHIERAVLNLLEPVVGRGRVRVSAQLDLNLKNAHVGQYKETKYPDILAEAPQTSSVIHSTEKQVQNLIQQQHISIVIDGTSSTNREGIYQPRTAQEISLYRRLVETAIGYNADRGDTIEIQNVPFVFHKTFPKHPGIFMLNIFLPCFVLILIFISLFSICFKHKGNTLKKSSDFSSEMLEQIVRNPARIIAVIRNWIYMPKDSQKTDWLPIQKVGIILLALEENVVRQILVALEDDEVRQVAKTMTTLGVIPPQESARILTELYDAMFSGSAVVGNPERVQQILSHTSEKASVQLKDPLQQSHKFLWQDVANIDSAILASRLSDVSTEIVAYILYQLPTEKISEMMPYFQEKKATQILIHLSHIGHLNTATQQKMAQESLEVIQQILSTRHTLSGTEKTADVLSQMSNTILGQKVMQDISQKDPPLARKLASHLINFEDFAHWTDADIKTLLKHTTRSTATEALAQSPAELKMVIQRNIPSYLWTQLMQEIQAKEKELSEEQILNARQTMVETARTLLQQGKFDI